MKRPLIYTIDPARRSVHVTYRSQPLFAEWESTMEQIFSDPAYVPGFGLLLDRRYIMHPADGEYIRSMVAYMEKNDTRTNGARWAILVTDPGSFGMARMAEQLAPSDHIRAFRELEKAWEWVTKE
ncbi:MAG: hypothetical protein ABJF10_27405 [Chthoniobacter sp.]|uniref:hypothetical protein n=1 Tax=Chthoniobacter sp. TaxID=2510640 RepID=UPI0032AC10C9